MNDSSWGLSIASSAEMKSPGVQAPVLSRHRNPEQGSNLRPVGDEPTALPLSYQDSVPIVSKEVRGVNGQVHDGAFH